jgi:hypothetical protein
MSAQIVGGSSCPFFSESRYVGPQRLETQDSDMHSIRQKYGANDLIFHLRYVGTSHEHNRLTVHWICVSVAAAPFIHGGSDAGYNEFAP